MKWRILASACFVASLLLAHRFAADGQSAPKRPDVDFDADVRPILEAHCVSCHGPQKQKNGFRVDRREVLLAGGDSGEPAVVPGKSDGSKLLRLVRGAIDGMVMPPKGDHLTEQQIDVLRRWIDAGAAMPNAQTDDPGKHWSLQPVRPVDPPPANDPFIGNGIDNFILAKLRAKGLSPAPAAERRVLIRRMYFDLHGLPPTPAEVEAFVRDDGPQAYQRLVEKALASPRYGERWGQHWLDVVRYGDTDGFEVNTPRPNAWPYRDWVIKAFNDDLPYDRFITAQLAGDAIGDDAATGFLMAGPALLPGQTGKDLPSILQARQDGLHEIINATSTAFLGMTIGCARCHNHKFDPIPQSDYYGMQAVFAGVHYGERPLRGTDDRAREARRAEVAQELVRVERDLDEAEPFASTAEGVTQARSPVNARRNVERVHAIDARFIRFTIEATNNGIEPCIDELEIFADGMNVGLATAGAKATSSSNFPGTDIHKLEHVNDGRYGNSRSWISNEPAKGWVQIELPRTMSIDRIVWARDREGKFNDRLATNYRIDVAVEPGAWHGVATSRDRLPFGSKVPGDHPQAALQSKRDELSRLLQQLSAQPQVFAGVFQAPETTYRLHRGDPMQKRETLTPEALTVLKPQLGSLDLTTTAAEQDRRLALARWITRPDNPLTARVMVNRIWQHHFGVGLVDTPSDFGRNGAMPSHPELLDYLADRFAKSSWSIKAMHRLILLSSTYRQASMPRPDGTMLDAQSRLLWRYPPRRLEAEAIRDAILYVSGSLDLRTGGPGFLLFKPNDNYVRVYDAKEEWGPGDWRRMVYAHKVRMAQDGVFGAFDCPDAGLPAPKRSRSTTAIQALNLFNSTFMVQQADILAQRVVRDAGNDASAQIKQAFMLTVQRPPSAAEEPAAAEVAKQHGLPAVCRALFNANEFLFIP